MSPLRFLFPLVCPLLLIAVQAEAGEEVKESKATVVESPFDKGKYEIQLGAGAFSSFQPTTSTRPGFTDIDAAIRAGVMLNTPDGSGFLRGNFEFLLEGYGALLVEGPRTGYAGLGLMLRYNFVQPDSAWVPYFQIQGGGVYNDIYHDGSQRVFGSALEFDLGGGLGMRYIFSPRCGAFLEADYRHISNAGTAARNLGLNSMGGFLGVSVFF